MGDQVIQFKVTRKQKKRFGINVEHGPQKENKLCQCHSYILAHCSGGGKIVSADPESGFILSLEMGINEILRLLNKSIIYYYRMIFFRKRNKFVITNDVESRI